jgi:hypothetical protein
MGYLKDGSHLFFGNEVDGLIGMVNLVRSSFLFNNGQWEKRGSYPVINC